jgi:hypothetical protein
MTLCLRFSFMVLISVLNVAKKSKFPHLVLVLVPTEKKKKKGVNSSPNYKHLNLNPRIYNL